MMSDNGNRIQVLKQILHHVNPDLVALSDFVVSGIAWMFLWHRFDEVVHMMLTFIAARRVSFSSCSFLSLALAFRESLSAAL